MSLPVISLQKTVAESIIIKNPGKGKTVWMFTISL